MNRPAMAFAASGPADLMEAAPEAARAAYDLQKSELVELLVEVATNPGAYHALQGDILRLAHNLSGTATYFGEQLLGDVCAALEVRLGSGLAFDSLRADLADLCDRLRRAGR